MNNVHFHFLTHSLNCRVGGMEESSKKLVDNLLCMGKNQVSVYTELHDKPTLNKTNNLEVFSLKEDVDYFLKTGEENRGEIYRLSYEILKSHISQKIYNFPQKKHLIISFYTSSLGYIAQQVADSLDIPHIASIRGTDFNRDLRNPMKLEGLLWVYKRANYLVATNNTQIKTLNKILPKKNNIKLIHNSVTLPENTPIWTPTKIKQPLLLFSDIGFSYKKASLLLIESVINLIKKGLPINLKIFGIEEKLIDKNFLEAIEPYRKKQEINLFKHTPKNKLFNHLKNSHLYCSPSLGEGCSNSRMTALSLGIPMCITRTGAIEEISKGYRNIWWCEPASKTSYEKCLKQACLQLLENNIQPEAENTITTIRHTLNPKREKFRWEKVIFNTLIEHGAKSKKNKKRILFFAHDGTGLGHLKRLSLLAKSLEDDFSCLLVTGHKQVGEIISEKCEFVRLPYLSLEKPELMPLRNKIIKESIKKFKPDALVVDYLPLGKQDELKEIINSFTGRLYYIARGVMDAPESFKKGVLSGYSKVALEEKFHKIFIACDKRICDWSNEYSISKELEKKLEYIGYIGEEISEKLISSVRKKRGITNLNKWIVCSSGGGALAEKLIKEYTKLPKKYPKFYFDIIIGPKNSLNFEEEHLRLSPLVEVHHGSYDLPLLHAAADIVLCPGGYNSIVECLQGNTPIIVSPVQTKKGDEQYIHANRIKKFSQVDFVESPKFLDTCLQKNLNLFKKKKAHNINICGLKNFHSSVLKDLKKN